MTNSELKKLLPKKECLEVERALINGILRKRIKYVALEEVHRLAKCSEVYDKYGYIEWDITNKACRACKFKWICHALEMEFGDTTLYLDGTFDNCGNEFADGEGIGTVYELMNISNSFVEDHNKYIKKFDLFTKGKMSPDEIWGDAEYGGPKMDQDND